MRRLRSWRRFAADQRGVAAVEMALFGTLVVGALLNVVEIGRYAYMSTQVTSAGQAGAYATLASCPATETPVTTNCNGVEEAVTTAIEGTSLGDAISLDGSLTEAWYCVDDEGELVEVGQKSEARATNCQEVNSPSDVPGLYVRVRVTCDFEPIFPGLTLAAAFNDKIVRTAWMRVL